MIDVQYINIGRRTKKKGRSRIDLISGLGLASRRVCEGPREPRIRSIDSIDRAEMDDINKKKKKDDEMIYKTRSTSWKETAFCSNYLGRYSTRRS